MAVGGVTFQAGRQEQHVREPQGAWKQVLKGADGRRRGHRNDGLKRTGERRMGVGSCRPLLKRWPSHRKKAG